MLKDNLHYGNVEHRDVHNLYGMLQHRATYEGHLKRSQGKQRPFVLSRAFFIGTQRYGPVWTGDNFARWDHMVASIPMILSLSVSGIPFSGADVGGFFGNPDAELLIRWYQLGAFQPFFRAHAHIDTKRREPWLFGKENTDLIRSAIQQRYRNLPYLYTLNFEASQTGMPIMRPLFYEFPNNVGTFGIGDQFMLGSAFMVKAVSEPGQSFVTMYIPSESLWYDYSNYEQVKGDTHSLVDIPTPLDKLPVLIRGGSIIVRKERVRRSSLLQKHDPYTLLITLDSKGSAHGRLYVDDGESFDFEEGKYILNELEFQNGILTSYNRNSDAQFVRLIERIVIVSSQLTKQKYTRVSSHAQNQDTLHGLEQKMDHISSRDTAKGGQIIVIKKPFVKVGEDWSLVLE